MRPARVGRVVQPLRPPRRRRPPHRRECVHRDPLCPRLWPALDRVARRAVDFTRGLPSDAWPARARPRRRGDGLRSRARRRARSARLPWRCDRPGLDSPRRDRVPRRSPPGAPRRRGRLVAGGQRHHPRLIRLRRRPLGEADGAERAAAARWQRQPHARRAACAPPPRDVAHVWRGHRRGGRGRGGAALQDDQDHRSALRHGHRRARRRLPHGDAADDRRR
mmetsp:Transcript_3101/g.7017  ORF Transcript_3101/g.7017 Transcript_3101/m.7017 type:complete len:221 (+) Transcript_3101:349-1011(+)